MTLSDHIPIIMNVTTRAIVKQIPPMLNFKETNWENFKEEVKNRIQNINHQDNLLKDVDRKLNQWYNATETAINNNIPTKSQVIDQKPITSAHLRYIQHEYKQLQQKANITGWNINTYNYYKTLNTALKQETEEIRDKKWENVIKRAVEKYKDPKTFW